MATLEQVSKNVHDLNITVNEHDLRLDNAEAAIKELQSESKAIYEINTNVRLLAENMNAVKEDVADVKEDVKEVKSNNTQTQQTLDTELDNIKAEISDVRNQPIKQKANVYDKIVWLIVGGAATYIASQIFEKIFK